MAPLLLRARRALARRLRARAAFALAVAVGLPAAAPAGQRFAGSILSVDTAAGELVLDDAGHRHRIALDSATNVRERGTDRTTADLKKGDRVVVSVEGEPPVARRVEVAGPAPRAGDGGPDVPGFASGLDARTPPR
ncbi:hypothetical protein KGQ64_06290 [bacterium]|nr:hypothetical protein [bacterium]